MGQHNSTKYMEGKKFMQKIKEKLLLPMGLKVWNTYGQQNESIQKMETPSSQPQKMNPSSFMNRRKESSSQPKTERTKEEKDQRKKKKKKSRVLGISCWQARSYLVMGPMVEVWAKVPWRGGEGREEGRFGLSPMDGGRKGGRKEGEGRRSKKSVDIWEFWPRESEAGRRTHLRTLLHKASSRSTSAHLFLPTNCPPNSPHRLSLSLSFSFSRLSWQPTSVSHACSHLFCSYFSLHITAGNHQTDCSISQFPNIMCACCTTSY